MEKEKAVEVDDPDDPDDLHCLARELRIAGTMEDDDSAAEALQHLGFGVQELRALDQAGIIIPVAGLRR